MGMNRVLTWGEVLNPPGGTVIRVWVEHNGMPHLDGEHVVYLDEDRDRYRRCRRVGGRGTWTARSATLHNEFWRAGGSCR